MAKINLGNKKAENLLLNPLFDLWQRNTTFTSVADGDYTADRFVYNKVGTMVHDVNRSADVPTDSRAKYSQFTNVTTAQASITATDYSTQSQKIEGYNLRKIKGKNAFVSFRAKSSKTGIHCVSFRNDANDKSYVVEYTINTINTWETKYVRVKHDETGTWDYTNQTGLVMSWALSAGTNFQTTADAWQAGNFLATANQVNLCDAVNNEFRITQVQLHEGIDEVPFNDLMRTYDDELKKCQRYYEKSYDVDTAPGTNTSLGRFELTGTSANPFRGSTDFQIYKRALPTVTTYSTAGTSGVIGTGAGDQTPTFSTLSTKAFIVYYAAANYTVLFQWVSDAEL